MFTLEKVVAWGRSFDEYVGMFALSAADLRLKMLGCGDGPASFNAEATRRGLSVVSCDPVYAWEADAIRDRIAATRDRVVEETRRNADQFLWTTIRSVEELTAVRMAAMNDFLDDYPDGRATGRYVDAALPELPFARDAFDLALCSHFLFLYADQLDAVFHRDAVREMCRVAREIRIFPLIAMGGGRSPHVDPVVTACRAAGATVTIEKVGYEFRRGGNEMMRIRT